MLFFLSPKGSSIYLTWGDGSPPPMEIISICAGFIMDSSSIFHAYWSVSVNPSGTAVPCHHPGVCYAAPHRGGLICAGSLV